MSFSGPALGESLKVLNVSWYSSVKKEASEVERRLGLTLSHTEFNKSSSHEEDSPCLRQWKTRELTLWHEAVIMKGIHPVSPLVARRERIPFRGIMSGDFELTMAREALLFRDYSHSIQRKRQKSQRICEWRWSLDTLLQKLWERLLLVTCRRRFCPSAIREHHR